MHGAVGAAREQVGSVEVPSTIGIVTDSTADLPWEDLPDAVRARIRVVPMQLVLESDGRSRAVLDGPDAQAQVLDCLAAGGRVHTSQPAPQALAAAYAELADAGCRGIVSVHLSGRLSGACESAAAVASSAGVPVRVVDSRSMAAGLGIPAATGAETAFVGGDLDTVETAVRSWADSVSVLLMTPSLEHLRRGGRLGAARTYLGSALAVRPILALSDGEIVPVERTRTTARAVERLAELAAEDVRSRVVAVHEARVRGEDARIEVVLHDTAVGPASGAAVSSQDDTQQLLAQVWDRLAADGTEAHVRVRISPMGAVAVAHLGPGALGVVVAG